MRLEVRNPIPVGPERTPGRIQINSLGVNSNPRSHYPGRVRRAHLSQLNLSRITILKHGFPVLFFVIKISDLLQGEFDIFAAAFHGDLSIWQQYFPCALKEAPVFVSDASHYSQLSIKRDWFFVADIKLHCDSPDFILADIHSPANRLVQDCGCQTPMQSAGIALMFLTGSEEGNQLVAFHLIKGGFEPGRVLQAANETHPGIMLFASDFLRHGLSLVDLLWEYSNSINPNLGQVLLTAEKWRVKMISLCPHRLVA